MDGSAPRPIDAADLPDEDVSGPDGELARRHRPRILLDDNEPFPPLVAGYTVYRSEARSVSSKFLIRPKAAAVIEYAVWYDFDIQHLYDLEHIWVHVDAGGTVVAVEASRHGARRRMRRADGSPPVEDGRPVLIAEPGKHAHWADGEAMRRHAGAIIAAVCGPFAGEEGVHLSNPFGAADLIGASALENRLARLKLKRATFSPSFAFTRSSDDGDGLRLVPYDRLRAFIPARVTALVAALPASVPHLAAVFLDCGDTLVDEATEVKRPGTDVVVEGALIPGAGDMVRELVRQGHRLALVADGPRETFRNLLGRHGLWDLFEAHVISEDVGVLKPDPRMFAAASAALGLGRGDRGRTVMVGNNLERDIAGANRFGLISVFLAWSTKRSHRPAVKAERPLLTLRQIGRLPDLLERIELALPADAVARDGAGEGAR